MERYRRQQAVDPIYIPRQAKSEITGSRIELYDVAAASLGDVPLQYLEFGVSADARSRKSPLDFTTPKLGSSGSTASKACRKRGVTWPEALSRCAAAPPASADPRISFVSGWFQNSLPEFFTVARLNRSHPVLVHYDADLYSSILFVLSTLRHHVPEYNFIFDEFMSEEVVALHDFARGYPIELEFLCQTNAGGYPSQVFGRLRRVSFIPDRPGDPAGA